MPLFNKDTRTEYHLITCDHPLMIDVGMSSFTLPQLMEWWFYKDYNGEYVNQKLFPSAKYIGIDALLKEGTPPEGEKNYTISAWRFEDYNMGVYQEYKIDETWEYYNKNPDAPSEDLDNFVVGDLPINTDEVIGKEFNRITKDFQDFNRDGLVQITKNILATDLIVLNDKYNIMGYDMENTQDRAAKQLFKDIKRSKNAGYISWYSDVSLDLNLVRGAEPCESYEKFKFKLYLYGSKRPLNRSKSQAFNSINIAAPAIGPAGVNNKDKVDGESIAVVDDSPNNKVGGNLKISHRSLDGKFSAGSEQIFGIVASENGIPAAKLVDDPVDWAENQDIEENFQDPKIGKYIVPGTGEIFPLDVQNANPFQWSTNYAEPKGCRETNEKVKVRVFNMNPQSFGYGDSVKASDMYSLWFIDPMASSVITPEITRKPVRNWQFTYFLTNEPHYLRFADGWKENGFQGSKDIYTQANNNARHNYAEIALGQKYFKTALGQEGYTEYFNGLTPDEKDAGTSWKGYAQITSWDFMDPEFAGLRSIRGVSPSPDQSLGNALVLTNSKMDHEGNKLETYNDYGTLGRTMFTAPFFGCTFPDGYVDQEKYYLFNGVPYDPTANIDDRSFSGSGWRPNSFGEEEDVPQNNSFFNLNNLYKPESSGDLNSITSGIFDPFAYHNNISTNVSPYWFLTEDQKSGVPHCNLFSSGPSLFHLPADIATNASWSGVNGYPILNLNNVQKYITSAAPYDKSFQAGVDWDNVESIQSQFHNFWLDSGSFQWLWNTIDPDKKIAINNPDNSILDLTPANRNKVEFRPARDGLVMQFDPPQGVNVDVSAEIPYPGRYMNQLGFNNFDTSVFGGSINSLDGTNPKYGVSHWGGNKPLWGYKTKERLLFHDEEGEAGLFMSLPAQNGDAGLGDPAIDGRIMPFKYEIYSTVEKEFAAGTTSKWHAPIAIYANSPRPNNSYLLPKINSNRSRGAFSVIGAACTTQIIQEGIEFTTEAFIGQGHHFLGGVFYASAGGRALSYADPNSTALYVKIYEGWPRDQTIYDPRFFAVHHFNAGNRLQIRGTENFYRPWQKEYSSSLDKVTSHSVSGEPAKIYNPDLKSIGYVDVNYFDENNELSTSGVPVTFDKELTNVDMRVPSHYSSVNFDRESLDVAAILPFNTNRVLDVFNEGIIREDDAGQVIENDFWMPNSTTIKDLENRYDPNTEQDEYETRQRFIDSVKKYTPVANPEHWDIDPDRRARMLPWPYKKVMIGVPSPKIINLNNVKEEYTLNEVVTKHFYGNIIVKASGEGYEIGDKFTTQGGNGTGVSMEVSATGEVGNPTQFSLVKQSYQFQGSTFEYIKHGEGFLPEDFSIGEASGVNENTTSQVRLVSDGGTNNTFRGYIVSGRTWSDETFIDYKPRIASTEKEPYRLSINDNSLEETGATTFRDTEDIQIIPMGNGVIIGDGTSTIAQPGLDKTDPVGGTTTAQIVLDPELEDISDKNPNVIQYDYDCFFYCVSDMSHQWIDKNQSAPAGVENYLTMEIKAY